MASWDQRCCLAVKCVLVDYFRRISAGVGGPVALRGMGAQVRVCSRRVWFTLSVAGEVNGGASRSTSASGDATDPSVARLRDCVARRRIELGLSQRGLADRAGVSLGTATRQWPRGTFQAIRDGEDPPKVPPRQQPSAPPAAGLATASAMRSATQYGQALSIASSVVAITAVCLDVLTGAITDTTARAAALAELDATMRQMESLIAASLPDAQSFDEAIAALREVHHSRESIQKAAESLAG